MSDNIIGIDGGKKKKKDDVVLWDFEFFLHDGTSEIYRGEFIGLNSMIEGFFQVIPEENKDGEEPLTLIAASTVKKIISHPILEE